MEKINTYEDYTGVVSRIFKRLHFDTNNLNSTQNVKEKIKEGSMYCEEDDWGAWILTDVGEYYLAVIYLVRGKTLPVLKDMDKPVVAELIGTEKRYAVVLESALQEVGFRAYVNNLELVSSREDAARLGKVVAAGKSIFAKHGFGFHNMSELNEKYMKQICRLWKDVIDPFAIHELTQEEYYRLKDTGRGIFVTDAQGEIAGAGYYEKEGAISYAHHIAVQRKYNGLGLGGVIMNACAEKAFQENTEKYISWIAEDNEESIRIHKRMGVFTGKYSRQFLLQKEKR